MTDVTPEEVALSRSRTYWLLGDVFLHRPEAPNLARFRAALGDAPPPGPDAGPQIFDTLRAALEQADEAELLVEYTRLFGGLREGYGLPPPFESVHRESRLLGDTTLAVLHAYQQAGFRDIHPPAGPQDHLGVELRFMALLAHEEMQAWRDGATEAALARLAEQDAFLARHLSAWVPGYCGRLAEQTREPVYAEVATLTGRVVVDDRALVSAMLADAVV